MSDLPYFAPVYRTTLIARWAGTGEEAARLELRGVGDAHVTLAETTIPAGCKLEYRRSAHYLDEPDPALDAPAPEWITTPAPDLPAAEPRYTLAQARQRLAEDECAEHGHDYDIVTSDAGPVAIDCSRCGRRWDYT